VFDVSFEESTYEQTVNKALEFYLKPNDLEALKILVVINGGITNENTLPKLKCIEILFKVSLVDILIKKYKCKDVEEFYANLGPLKLPLDELGDIGDEAHSKRLTKLRKKERAESIQSNVGGLGSLLNHSKFEKNSVANQVKLSTSNNELHIGKSPFSMVYKAWNDFIDIQNKLAESLGRPYKRANSNAHHSTWFFFCPYFESCSCNFFRSTSTKIPE